MKSNRCFMYHVANIFLLICLLLNLSACDNKQNSSAAPANTSISPTARLKGTPLTLISSSSNTENNNNKVQKNDGKANVNDRSANGPDLANQEVYTVSTVAGSGTYGLKNGNAMAAEFNSPTGIAINAKGNLYVADSYNHSIRMVSAAGMVTTVAGGYGYVDGPAATAKFNYPSSIATDSEGNVYVADDVNHCIRKISLSGEVSTFAGGSSWGLENGKASVAKFNSPTSLAFDRSGNLFVADSRNYCIRKITPQGIVSLFAGSIKGYSDGLGSAAKFSDYLKLAVDGAGYVYVSDVYNNSIRKISPAGLVTTLAGSTTAGKADGMGASASFDNPKGLAVDKAGNIFVADNNNHTIRKITPKGMVSTIAGSEKGYEDGTGTTAKFNGPIDITIDAKGDLYIADNRNERIRKISVE